MSGESMERANRLAGQPSAYLAQHARNPIDWHPWGPEALQLARREDRPIFLSVGYASCHWCHVMAHEVFEKDDVARLLNEGFVSIKVDREERPDIDAVYMEAVMALTGSGGWPMSVFLTPDLRPFYGGTYYPHDTFMALLESILRAWTSRRDDLARQGDRLFEIISREPALAQGTPVDETMLQGVTKALLDAHDGRNGGLAGRMKFPTPLVWMFLLHRLRKTGDADIEAAVRRTLDAMATGGIHDHVSGGFHRYTVESTWLIPHFEKMLYDNALLAMLYTEAHAVLGDPHHGRVARSTLDFLIEEMSDEGRGFFASMDADSDGEEGSFYVWTPEQIAQAAGEEAPALALLVGVDGRGNFEGRSVLTLRTDPVRVARMTGMPLDRVETLLDRMRPALRDLRNRRVAPALDRKIVTSWNGLAMAAMARGFSLFGDARYLDAALGTAQLLHTLHRSRDGRLVRSSSGGMTSGPGVIEDYACTAWGWLEIFGCTSDPDHLERAVELTDMAIELFSRPGGGFLHSDGSQDPALPRLVQMSDGATPSGASTLLHLLVALEALTGNPQYGRLARETLRSHSASMLRRGADMAWWWDAAEMIGSPFFTVVVTGDPDDPLKRDLVSRHRRLAPGHAVLVQVTASGADRRLSDMIPSVASRASSQATEAHVCSQGRCGLPVRDPARLEEQLLETRRM